jgi:hypothetical protein
VLDVTFTSNLKNEFPTFYHNLRAIAFRQINRISDCFFEINQLARLKTVHPVFGRLFPTTVDYLLLNTNENSKLEMIIKELLDKLEKKNLIVVNSSFDLSDLLALDLNNKLNMDAENKNKHIKNKSSIKTDSQNNLASSSVTNVHNQDPITDQQLKKNTKQLENVSRTIDLSSNIMKQHVIDKAKKKVDSEISPSSDKIFLVNKHTIENVYSLNWLRKMETMLPKNGVKIGF